MTCCIFIDYSNKDKLVAESVVAAIENTGLKCWIAPRDISPGDSWGQSIVDAIETSTLVVLIHSNNTSQSNLILNTISKAFDLGKAIITFQIDQTNLSNALSYYLSTTPAIAAHNPPTQNDLSQLLQQIQELLPPDESIIESTEQMANIQTKSQKEISEEKESHTPWMEYLSNSTSNPIDTPKSHDQYETLRQIHRTLVLSENALRSNPFELPGQLMGRLSQSNNAGVSLLISSIEQKTHHPWLKPRQNCLPGPESSILASWPVLMTVPPCRLVLSDDTRNVCIVTQDNNLYWDIESGQQLTDYEAKTSFPDTEWKKWRTNLPEHQFEDEQLMGKWSSETPPGPVVVSCSLERTRYAFNRSFTNIVAIKEGKEERILERRSRTAINASEGCLAPALSLAKDKVICGGLGGEISIWDISSGTRELTINIGNRTIISIAPYPELSKCAVLTLDGDLLIIDLTGQTQKSKENLPLPTGLHLAKDAPIGILTHNDGSLTIWHTEAGLLDTRDPGWFQGSPFARFGLTPDLSVAIITGHGDDQYDGWIITILNLIKGTKVFNCETAMSSERYGPLTLEQFDNTLFLRIDPYASSLSNSYTKAPMWVSLSTGKVFNRTPPTGIKQKIGWNSPALIIGKEQELGYAPWFTDTAVGENSSFNSISLSQDNRSIIVNDPEQPQIKFTYNQEIFFLGISPYDNAISIVTSDGLYTFDIKGKGG